MAEDSNDKRQRWYQLFGGAPSDVQADLAFTTLDAIEQGNVLRLAGAFWYVHRVEQMPDGRTGLWVRPHDPGSDPVRRDPGQYVDLAWLEFRRG